MATYTEILAEAKSAMLAILQGRIASYSLDGVTFTRLNLRDLQQLIQGYESLAAGETDSTKRTRVLLADLRGAGG